MSFRDFLDAAYALLVEGYTTIAPNQIDLLSAVEKIEGQFGGTTLPVTKEEAPAGIAKQNDQALAKLTMLTAGLA